MDTFKRQPTAANQCTQDQKCFPNHPEQFQFLIVSLTPQVLIALYPIQITVTSLIVHTMPMDLQLIAQRQI